jgi:hypothetical protein
MSALPTVLVSSVVRSAHQGESHGGLYLLDLASGARRHCVDWNTCEINWAGRGLDRGLRGVAFHNDEIWVAAADELFVFDQTFRQQRSYRNPYLGHCHEISCDGDRLYLTSTGFDSVLEFSLRQERFTRGWLLRGSPNGDRGMQLNYSAFDPNGDSGPEAGDSVHINNVFAAGGTLFVSALRLPTLLRIDRTGVKQAAPLPIKTHNARPFKQRLLFNNTGQEVAELRDSAGTLLQRYPIPRYQPADLINGDLPQDHARQAFARGLCVHPHDAGTTLIVGSSPATVSAFDLDSGAPLASWSLTMDVRNAVHGLEVWPYALPEMDAAPAQAPRPIETTAPAAAGAEV